MNEKVIEKIADELGIAVGTAGDFIADMLPQYAALQIMNTIPCVIILLLVCIAAIVAIVICVSRLKKEDDNWEYRVDYLMSSIGVAIVLVFCILLLSTIITEIAGWYMFPEAMLLDMAMEAVGC